MARYIVIGLLFFTYYINAQIKYKDLKGSWITDNSDSLFFKADTLVFLNSSNRLYCNNMLWYIDRPNNFNWSQCDCCNEPPRITMQTLPQRLKFKDEILYYFLNGTLKNRYKILELLEIDYKSETGIFDMRTRQLILLKLK